MLTLQSIKGSLQGRNTTQGDPCSHYREWVCSVQLFSVLVTFFPCFINIFSLLNLYGFLCFTKNQIYMEFPALATTLLCFNYRDLPALTTPFLCFVYILSLYS